MTFKLGPRGSCGQSQESPFLVEETGSADALHGGLAAGGCPGRLEVRRAGGLDGVGSCGEAGFYLPALGSSEAPGGGVGAENPLFQPVCWRP